MAMRHDAVFRTAVVAAPPFSRGLWHISTCKSPGGGCSPHETRSTSFPRMSPLARRIACRASTCIGKANPHASMIQCARRWHDVRRGMTPFAFRTTYAWPTRKNSLKTFHKDPADLSPHLLRILRGARGIQNRGVPSHSMNAW